MRAAIIGAAATLYLSLATPAQAQVTQSFGRTFTAAEATNIARFESMAALSDNPYVEDGLSFTRTNLTFNNNGCGYAGSEGAVECRTLFSSIFSGNYMYGATINSGPSYFSMFPPVGTLFNKVEFLIGTGLANRPFGVAWSAHRDGSEIGSGSTLANFGTAIAFFSDNGFDELRYTGSFSEFSAPSFDNVFAQTDRVVTNPVPEPAAWALLALGIGLLGATALRRGNRQA